MILISSHTIWSKYMCQICLLITWRGVLCLTLYDQRPCCKHIGTKWTNKCQVIDFVRTEVTKQSHFNTEMMSMWYIYRVNNGPGPWYMYMYITPFSLQKITVMTQTKNTTRKSERHTLKMNTDNQNWKKSYHE